MSEENGTLRERLEELERVIQDYEKKLFLDKIKIQDTNLEVNRENILAMEAIDINIMCMEWAYYSIGLQKELNVAVSRLNWVDSVLERYLGDQSPNYYGYGFAEKKAAVLASDSYAQKLYEFKQKCKLIVDRSAFMTSKVDFLTKMAQNVAYAKRGEKNES